MDSLRDQSSAPVPEEFRPRPDLSMLRWKLFVLATRGDSQSVTPAQRRRRREGTDRERERKRERETERDRETESESVCERE